MSRKTDRVPGRFDGLEEALAVYFGAGLGRTDDEALFELLRDAAARGMDVEEIAKDAAATANVAYLPR